MRKLQRLYVALGLLVGIFTACSQNEDFDTQRDEVALQVITDIASQSVGEPAIKDFIIEFWNKDDNSLHDRARMTYNNMTGWSTLKSSVLPAYVLAYRGNGTVNARSATDYTVSPIQDQSSEEAYNAADMLLAKGEANKTDVLSLKFEHCFSRVAITVIPEGESFAKTSIDKLEVATKDKTVPFVTAFYYKPAMQFLAYVVPGTYSENEIFCRVTLGDKVLFAKMKNKISFRAGAVYYYDLAMGKDN